MSDTAASGGGGDAPRFVEVLTTAATLCDFHGHESVEASHVLQALDVLEGHIAMEDLGHGLSPLVRRGSTTAPASSGVRDLVARWYEALGGDVHVPLDEAQRERLRAELQELDPGAG